MATPDVLYQANFTTPAQMKDYLVKNPEVVDILGTRQVWNNHEKNPLLEIARINYDSRHSGPGLGVSDADLLDMMKLLVDFGVNLEAYCPQLNCGHRNGIDLLISGKVDDPASVYDNIALTALQWTVIGAPRVAPFPMITLLLENGANAGRKYNVSQDYHYENYNYPEYNLSLAQLAVNYDKQAASTYVSGFPVNKEGNISTLSALSAKIRQKPVLEATLEESRTIAEEIVQATAQMASTKVKFEADTMALKKKFDSDMQALKEKYEKYKTGHHEKVVELSSRENFCPKGKREKMIKELQEITELTEVLRLTVGEAGGAGEKGKKGNGKGDSMDNPN